MLIAMNRLNEHVWWYLSRASGLVSWAALTVSCALGILLATRLLKPHDRPAWLLALHRHLSAIFIATLAVHLLGLVLDSYVTFSWREILIPGESAWESTGVALGVVAMYLALVVQGSSLLMKRIPRRVWRSIHLLAYLAFVLVSIHALWVGSDVRNLFFIITASCLSGALLLLVGVRVLYLKQPSRNTRTAGLATAPPSASRGEQS